MDQIFYSDEEAKKLLNPDNIFSFGKPDNFTFQITGKNYSVPSQVLLDAVSSADHEDEDYLKVMAAEEAFFKAINGKLIIDGSRSFCHRLTIDGEEVWRHHWKYKQKGNFNQLDLHDALSEHLYNLGLIEKP